MVNVNYLLNHLLAPSSQFIGNCQSDNSLEQLQASFLSSSKTSKMSSFKVKYFLCKSYETSFTSFSVIHILHAVLRQNLVIYMVNSIPGKIRIRERPTFWHISQCYLLLSYFKLSFKLESFYTYKNLHKFYMSITVSKEMLGSFII